MTLAWPEAWETFRYAERNRSAPLDRLLELFVSLPRRRIFREPALLRKTFC